MTSGDGPGGSLLGRYTNAVDALPEKCVLKTTGEQFHRQSIDTDEAKPACSTQKADSDWRAARTEQARAVGLQPCHRCFAAVLEYLAIDDDSPVGLRGENTGGEVEIEADGGPELRSDIEEKNTAERVPVASLTEEVKVASGSNVMHAPTSEGTVCGRSVSYRLVERAVVEATYRPCSECFDLDE